MHHISKSAIVPYSNEQMYNLVNQINDYPDFLNWCSQSAILKQTDKQITASIKINKGIFQQNFTTVNTLTPFNNIHMQLKDGPFSHLSGDWKFITLNAGACKVSLELDFNFSSKIIDLTISPIFTKIANSQLDAFVARAKYVYSSI